MSTTPRSLIDLPNISFKLAEQLKLAGIRAADVLKGLGTEATWHRLRAAGIHPEFTALLAVEGAILGIAWHQVSRDRRRALMALADLP